MIIDTLKKITQEKQQQNIPNFIIKNFLKEYLQYPVLSFIYNQKDYKKLIFNGGSCLRVCYGLPRLSEDLDFDYLSQDFKNLDLDKLANDLSFYFRDRHLLEPKIKVQSDMRIYLKFPILKQLALAPNISSESDFLYVKLEIAKSNFRKPNFALNPISEYEYNFVVKSYNLEYLMTGKIKALLTRIWFKEDKNKIDIKGRDFYDLFWYLKKKIEPNWSELKKTLQIKDKNDFKKIIENRIEKNVNTKKLAYDLKNFFADQNFVNDFCKNYKKIILNLLKDF
jgi:predicted nucleotidyltransferase component of viral defense system